MINKAFILLLVVLLSGCSTVLKTPDAPSIKGDPLSSYQKVLDKFVNDKGQVDFEGLAKDRAQLDHYVSYVAKTPFSAFSSEDEKLAHYINAYNALSMFAVIEKDIPETNSGLNKIGFFFLTKMDIGGEQMSLYTFENDIIRKMGEERIHFALNCMAVSCPKLPKKIFTAKNVRGELENEAKFFFNEARNLKVDNSKKEVYISEILDFFTEDFVPAKAPNLIDYVNKYSKEKVPAGYEVEFFDYDWTINNSNKLK